MYKRNGVILSVLALGALGFAVYSAAFSQNSSNAVAARTAVAVQEEKKAPNVQKDPKEAKETARSKGHKDLALAYQLIQYGRANKNAESLLLAAQIIHKTPTEELKYNVEKPAETKGKVKVWDNSPKALLAEAKKLSSSAAVEALAAATAKILEEETRGTVGPPLKAAFTIYTNEVITTRPVEFFGGERAKVFVSLNGVSGRCVLDVLDQNGNVVARDSLPGNYYSVEWVPTFTSSYRIRLANLDTISFNCLLLSN